MSEILITDSLFVGAHHVAKLESAGHNVTRLDKVKADADELKDALQGKDGYILGGIEEVTDDVIAAATELKAISFTGSGFHEFIPGWKTATERGIAITAARGRNAESVAEWALACSLALSRDILRLSAPIVNDAEGKTDPNGGADFSICQEFKSQTIGIVGYGRIGRELARKGAALGFHIIVSDSQLAHDDYASVVALDELLATADIVSVHVNRSREEAALNATAIAALKPGAVVVNAAFKGAVDDDALLRRIVAREIKAAVDYKLDGAGLPVGRLISSNVQTAYNTEQANERVSTRVTEAILNLLETGFDTDLVNPGYLNANTA